MLLERVQVTNFFSCSEEFGEVFGNKMLSLLFMWKIDRKSATKNPSRISLPKVNPQTLANTPECTILSSRSKVLLFRRVEKLPSFVMFLIMHTMSNMQMKHNVGWQE